MNLLLSNQIRYLENHAFLKAVGEADIAVLADFLHNKDGIEQFWKTYYGPHIPRVVICGINPGRHGAGKTGIPFLDYQSLAKLIPNTHRADSERTADFFYRVVSRLGADLFFRTFYVTNISSVGFVRDGRNLNFYDLPLAAIEMVEQYFRSEIRFVQPTHVISLGVVVQETARRVLPSDVDCSIRLPHPSWITTCTARS